MTNIHILQQNLIEVQERINREIQFGEDTQRELLATVNLLRESLTHLEQQITLLFNERGASLSSALGHPARPQTVHVAASVPHDVLPPMDQVQGSKQEAAE